MIDATVFSEAAPRPWSTTTVGAPASGGFHIYITDANGRKIAAIWGGGEEKASTAELIVGAVNAALAG